MSAVLFQASSEPAAVRPKRKRGGRMTPPAPVPAPGALLGGEWRFVGLARPEHGQTRWIIECSCGVHATRYAADVRGGRSLHCDRNPAEHALYRVRARARAVECPRCKAAAGAGCSFVCGASYEWGVHVERARLAGVPVLPTVAELEAGVSVLRVSRGRRS